MFFTMPYEEKLVLLLRKSCQKGIIFPSILVKGGKCAVGNGNTALPKIELQDLIKFVSICPFILISSCLILCPRFASCFFTLILQEICFFYSFLTATVHFFC